MGTRFLVLACAGVRTYKGMVVLSAPAALGCGMISSRTGSIQLPATFKYAAFCNS